jgi:hypothetical protein
MNKIIKIACYHFGQKVEIEESESVFDRRSYYDVKFPYRAFDYVRKDDIGKPVKQSWVCATFLYVSKTEFEKNQDKYIQIAKDNK